MKKAVALGAVLVVAALGWIWPRLEPVVSETPKRAGRTAKGEIDDTAVVTPPAVKSTENETPSGSNLVVRAASRGAALPSKRKQINRDAARAQQIREQLSSFRRAPEEQAEVDGQEEPVARMPSLAQGENEEALARYMEEVMGEQYGPLVADCADQLAERRPALMSGRLVLSSSIGGTAEVGGVVEEVRVDEGATVDDEEFVMCVRESLYSVVFDAPPEDNVSVPLEVSIDLTMESSAEGPEAEGLEATVPDGSKEPQSLDRPALTKTVPKNKRVTQLL